MVDASERLSEQDLKMVESVLSDGEEYLDSLHNDGDRVIVVVTDQRVVHCRWKYNDGDPKVESSKNFAYDGIQRAISYFDKYNNEYSLLVHLNGDKEATRLIRMSEHFSGEVKNAAGIIEDRISPQEVGKVEETVRDSVGAILSNLDALYKLARLKEMGAISNEEYALAHERLLKKS